MSTESPTASESAESPTVSASDMANSGGDGATNATGTSGMAGISRRRFLTGLGVGAGTGVLATGAGAIAADKANVGPFGQEEAAEGVIPLGASTKPASRPHNRNTCTSSRST